LIETTVYGIASSAASAIISTAELGQATRYL